MQENKKSENCLKFTWFKTIFSSKYKDKRHKTITSGKVSHLSLTNIQSDFRSNRGYWPVFHIKDSWVVLGNNLSQIGQEP